MESNEVFDRMRCLKTARTLSSFGPDFNDSLTCESWLEKLKDIPFDVFRTSLAKLSGHKSFPAPNDIIEISRVDLKTSNDKLKTLQAEQNKKYVRKSFAIQIIPRLRVEESKAYNDAWNLRIEDNKMRKFLYERILATDEVQWIKRFYFDDFEFIHDEIINISYFEQFHEKLRHYFINRSYMLDELLPGIKFDFDPNRK